MAYQKLENSYDQMVHPQKRNLMKGMLENTIIRMCEVKQNLVKYSTHSNFIQSEYVNIDEILIELKLTPKAIKVHIPRYYQEKSSERDKIVESVIEKLKVSE